MVVDGKASWWRVAARDLARLVVPTECAGCRQPDVRLCEACAALWWAAPSRVESGAPRLDIDGGVPLPVWAVASLEGSAGETMRAWKDGSRRDLDRWLADAMARAGATISPALGPPARVSVVPVPPRRASTRRRGVDLTWVLARGTARGLESAGRDATAVRALALGAGESRGRSARQRWRASRGSVRVGRSAGAAAVVVDDVLTTGATLAACVAALERSGTAVIGALVATAAESGRASPPGGLLWDSDDLESTPSRLGR